MMPCSGKVYTKFSLNKKIYHGNLWVKTCYTNQKSYILIPLCIVYISIHLFIHLFIYVLQFSELIPLIVLYVPEMAAPIASEILMHK